MAVSYHCAFMVHGDMPSRLVAHKLMKCRHIRYVCVNVPYALCVFDTPQNQSTLHTHISCVLKTYTVARKLTADVEYTRAEAKRTKGCIEIGRPPNHFSF